MAWVVPVAAGLVEVAWAIGLKYTAGFTRPVPSVLTIGGGLVSFFLLAKAAQTVPIGSAYAVWTGIGAVGTAVLGMILFDESRDWARLACIGIVVVGVVGLKLVSAR